MSSTRARTPKIRFSPQKHSGTNKLGTKQKRTGEAEAGLNANSKKTKIAADPAAIYQKENYANAIFPTASATAANTFFADKEIRAAAIDDLGEFGFDFSQEEPEQSAISDAGSTTSEDSFSAQSPADELAHALSTLENIKVLKTDFGKLTNLLQSVINDYDEEITFSNLLAFADESALSHTGLQNNIQHLSSRKEYYTLRAQESLQLQQEIDTLPISQLTFIASKIEKLQGQVNEQLTSSSSANHKLLTQLGRIFQTLLPALRNHIVLDDHSEAGEGLSGEKAKTTIEQVRSNAFDSSPNKAGMAYLRAQLDNRTGSNSEARSASSAAASLKNAFDM